MRTKMTPIINGMQRIYSKNLEKRLGEMEMYGRINCLQLTELKRSPRILQDSCLPDGNCYHSNSS